jgi:hypothetical protein
LYILGGGFGDSFGLGIGVASSVRRCVSFRPRVNPVWCGSA